MKRPLLFLLVLVVVLVGCSSPAVPAPESPLAELGERFQVALPRITVDVAEDGTPSILGISPDILRFVGVDTSAFKLPADTVQRLSEENIQHIEVAVVDRGLRIWVNGEPLPFVQTDSASLERTIGLLKAVEFEQAAMLERLLPILTRLGLDFALRFPVQSGAEAIPLTTVGEARQAPLAPTTDPASVVAKFEVKYDEEGNPSIMGVDASPVMGQVLSPELIQKLQAADVQSLEIRSNPAGMTIYVDNEPLPTLLWDSALLGNATTLLSGYLPEDSTALPLIEAFLPTLDRGDVDILIHLPLAPGATPIPVEMHD
jgi:hypothetical protein